MKIKQALYFVGPGHPCVTRGEEQLPAKEHMDGYLWKLTTNDPLEARIQLSNDCGDVLLHANIHNEIQARIPDQIQPGTVMPCSKSSTNGNSGWT